MTNGRDGRTTQTSAGTPAPTTGRARQRALMIAALPEGEDLAELAELLRTAGVATVGQIVQHRDTPDPHTYLGSGKVIELKHAVQEQDANVVVCDDELTPRQQRSLEEELKMPVLDRTAVILDIFAGHANSAEGKLQVELAQLEYNMARMRGLWTHLERLGGGIGTRGPGESQIETDRRLARDRMAKLRRRLREVQENRSVMRAERERAHLPTIALAGYTNAGKSTLLNTLTGADVSVRDRLFHTLDPSTRTMRHDGRTYLVTDTVGFIRKLPHQLVDAFGATLEETRRADLVLHVVDASGPTEELDLMISAVTEVLAEIGANEAPQVLVLNKIDRIESRAPGALLSAKVEEALEPGSAGLQEAAAAVADAGFVGAAADTAPVDAAADAGSGSVGAADGTAAPEDGVPAEAEVGSDHAPSRLDPDAASDVDWTLSELSLRFPDAVLVSAATGEGIPDLLSRIEHEFEKTLRDMHLLVPYSEGAVLSELHDIAGDLQRQDTPDGVLVTVRLAGPVAERFGRWATTLVAEPLE